jgi:hypothetical protein
MGSLRSFGHAFVEFTIFYYFSHLLDTSLRPGNYVLFEPFNP